MAYPPAATGSDAIASDFFAGQAAGHDGQSVLMMMMTYPMLLPPPTTHGHRPLPPPPLVGGAMCLYNEPQTSAGCIPPALPTPYHPAQQAWLVAAPHLVVGAPVVGETTNGAPMLLPAHDWATAAPLLPLPDGHIPPDGARLYRLVPADEEHHVPDRVSYVVSRQPPVLPPRRGTLEAVAFGDDDFSAYGGGDTNLPGYQPPNGGCHFTGFLAPPVVRGAPAAAPYHPSVGCPRCHPPVAPPMPMHAEPSTVFELRPADASSWPPTPPTFALSSKRPPPPATTRHGPHHHHHQDPMGAPTGHTRPPNDQSRYGDDNFTPTNAAQLLTPSVAWLGAAPGVARPAALLRTPSQSSVIDGGAIVSPTPSVLTPPQRPNPRSNNSPRGSMDQPPPQRGIAVALPPHDSTGRKTTDKSYQSPRRPQLDVGLTMIDALCRERDDDGVARRIDALTSPGQLDVLVAALEASPKVVYDLCVNDRGRIIARVLRRVGAAVCPVALTAVCMYFEEIATSKFGCFAIPAIAKELTEPQAAKLFSYCVPLSPRLIAHPYGNFVVNYFMSCGCDSIVAQLCAKVSEDPSNVHRAAVDRHGTYTIETILKNGSAAALRPLFDALLLHSDQSLLDLCSHERGSYAVESAFAAMQRVKNSLRVRGRALPGPPLEIDFARYVDAARRVLDQTPFAKYIDRSLKKLGLDR